MKVALLPNLSRDHELTVSRKVADYLLSLGCEVLSCESNISDRIKVFSSEEAVANSDFCVTVGGDGTILHAAQTSSKYKKPMIGINMGKIGYLAELEPNEIPMLKRIVVGDFETESRLMLDCSVFRNNEEVFTCTALNDAVLSHGEQIGMLSTCVYVSGEMICDYSSDGVIFSTPTGSTAYSLSAGGPVVQPSLQCFIITPICPHSLILSRSIITDGKDIIETKILSGKSAFLSCDGDCRFRLEENDTIRIVASERHLELIKLKKKSFFSILADKIK